MKHVITSLLLLVAATLGAGATEPIKIDRASIKAKANSEAYNTLIEKFKSGETLPTEDIMTIYYGAALRPGFNADASYTPIISAFTTGDITRAYTLAAKAIETDPTNLMLLFKGYACAAASSDPVVKGKATAYRNMLLQICDMIFNTALGVSENSPYQVTRPGDIDEFLVKYIQPAKVTARAKLGNLDAVKAKLDGIDDEVIFYFNTFK